MYASRLRVGLWLFVEGPAEGVLVVGFLRIDLHRGLEKLQRALEVAQLQQDLALAVERLRRCDLLGIDLDLKMSNRPAAIGQFDGHDLARSQRRIGPDHPAI